MKKTVKHPVRWFLNRAGKEIALMPYNLLHPPIKIESEGQAKALFINQSKGYRYQEI
jgi:hypothetical protein